MGWFNSDVRSRMPVCKKKPNELGLFDIIGNNDEYLIDNTCVDNLIKYYNEYGVFYDQNEKWAVGYISKARGLNFRIDAGNLSPTPMSFDDDRRLWPKGFRVVRTAYPKY